MVTHGPKNLSSATMHYIGRTSEPFKTTEMIIISRLCLSSLCRKSTFIYQTPERRHHLQPTTESDHRAGEYSSNSERQTATRQVEEKNTREQDVLIPGSGG